jgi:hypothetical protein
VGLLNVGCVTCFDDLKFWFFKHYISCEEVVLKLFMDQPVFFSSKALIVLIFFFFPNEIEI